MIFFGLVSGGFGLLISLLIIAFFVLGERKILGYSQSRKGPNKVGLVGLLQSFADLLKLVVKFKIFYFQSRSYVGLFGVVLLVVLVIVYFLIYGSYYSVSYSNLSVLWFLAVTSISSYSLLCVGWGSYNNYSFLSSIRCAFGSVSFEACFMCVVIFCALSCWSYNLVDFYYSNYWCSWLLFPLMYGLFLVCVLCETNRTPFDYGESESELVSGFNVEYSGIYFTCLFACEYVIIYVFSWLVVVLMVGGGMVGLFLLVFNLLFFMWARATLPRIRYDCFVNFFWEVCLCLLILSFFVIVN
uniref:NADH-ubiquinone oxidoreductase chain 1 n=1 Tax=Echinococcus shiquicus TaxID=260967 RepID=Q58A05_9CEST|nr:NADH dehydrogenase subunit 1 [Echinococcus shiquicus]QPT54851.1 NADH dehydrogenase subunit 1 [Echinococcus shiquicus]QPT54852.1 NADH dehydrogenase subunit 1 [Echinococcus shiquicus]QPT54853.1 NADH dehydrogenase subunit 1 [Echinococcus shiquicus]QPT54854.1 NADH dehydrogenase subunit 1 [Echinococcus shiquicus]QTH79611.1 NADH dehydrogenase subunit 1 [Echinococcus shiquicus]